MASIQFDPDFRFEVDDSFSMYSQAMSCPSTGTSFSSASSACDPFTPTSRRSTPNELTFDIDASFAAHNADLTPPSTAVPKYMFGQPVKAEAEHLGFPDVLPSTPIKRMDSISSEYEAMLGMGMQSHNSMGSITPSNAFPMYTISPQAAMGPGSFMMTPTHSISGSDMADSASTWSCANDSPISFFPQKSLPSNDFESLEIERQCQSPIGRYYLQGPPPSPGRLRAHRKMMVHEIQRKTSDLQRAQIRSSRKPAEKHDGSVDVVRRAMCKCDYPGCHKAFRRNEHLKRHKQT